MLVQDFFLGRTQCIPLSPQKETHNIVVRYFLENKKHKILLKNLGSMLVQDSFLGRT
jgi:hypothetical protein